MIPMKRVGLAVLALILVVLFAPLPAQARKPVGIAPVEYTYELDPPGTEAPEPRASGNWTLETWTMPSPSVGVTVSCRRLTPAKQYSVKYWVVWYPLFADGTPPVYWRCDSQFVTANARGRLNAQFTVKVGDLEAVSVVGLWVENVEGDVVLEER